MHLLAETLPTSSMVFLILAIGLALAFEFVNGFHDTANAVATVIYTHSLPAWIAVIWSGCWNLIGVLTSSGAVAFGILALLPVELVLNVGSSAGFAMVFSLLISAILWNVGTWYLGLPASSSHTLIGSILGVGLANSMMTTGHSFGEGVNWATSEKTFLFLVISPIIGFVCSALLLLVAKALIKNPAIFKAPPKDAPPPTWIRGLLILTCTGVSFAHGSNDGQKGMGLVLLILIGILPGTYALNMNTRADDLRKIHTSAVALQSRLEAKANGVTFSKPGSASDNLSTFLKTGKPTPQTYGALAEENRKIIAIAGASSIHDIPEESRREVRTNIYLVSSSMDKLNKLNLIDKADQGLMAEYGKQLDGTTKWVPLWVKVAIAISLGLGTMIGWKRIVKTVGEKIGKEHLNYGQGASAELVAMCTIIVADHFGQPVSTTHVLSSGVAGTMAANHSGLQMATLRNIMLAWVLTLPVCVILGAGTFSAGLYLVFHGPIAVVVAVAALIAAGILAWRVGLFGALRTFSSAHGESELTAGAVK